MKRVTITDIDDFIDEFGVGKMFDRNDLAWWLERNHDFYDATGLASRMLQLHRQSQQTPNPARHVLDCIGSGRGAQWVALTPALAFRSARTDVYDAIMRLNNQLNRSGAAIAFRRESIGARFAQQRMAIDLILKLLTDVADEGVQQNPQ